MQIAGAEQARLILQQAHSLPKETVESAIAYIDSLRGPLDKALKDLLYATIERFGRM